ncbi:MAG: homoserine dehydrogenase [Bdellovibrionales bacterium]
MLAIAIAGLGTVGGGVARLLRQNAGMIAARAGQPLVIKAACAKDKGRKSGCQFGDDVVWVEDPKELATVPGIDIVVEAMGGADGAAYELARAALSGGKSYVTANKALLATHGAELARLAEGSGARLMFEASVAGGIPVIKALREGLAANRVLDVSGIINGTCNFILTRMREGKLDFAEALYEAQANGYAEADPSFDVDGHDAACKIAILTALAFGIEPELASVEVEGVRRISQLDLGFAEELGCRIKLLASARRRGTMIEQRVAPALVPMASPLAMIEGVVNAVMLRGDFVGDVVLQGRGAGAEPTASAVVADLMDLARMPKATRGEGTLDGGLFRRAEGQGALVAKDALLAESLKARYYVRLSLQDRPGAVADITAAFRDADLSIESLLQHGRPSAGGLAAGLVPVVVTTHAVAPEALRRAVETLAHQGAVGEPPCVMRMEG